LRKVAVERVLHVVLEQEFSFLPFFPFFLADVSWFTIPTQFYRLGEPAHLHDPVA